VTRCDYGDRDGNFGAGFHPSRGDDLVAPPGYTDITGGLDVFVYTSIDEINAGKIIDGGADGDGIADFELLPGGAPVLTVSDFVL